MCFWRWFSYLRIRRNDIATLAQPPRDRVQDPQESGERTTVEEGLSNISAHGVGVLARLPDEHVDDPGERDAAEGEVAPLVRADDEGADEAGDDHDLVDEDGVHDGGPGQGGGQEEVEEEEGGGDDPVHILNNPLHDRVFMSDSPIDVANVVDLPVGPAHDGVVALVLDGDGREAQVGAHGEVSDGGDEGDGGGDVVEDALLAGLPRREAHKDEGRGRHARAHGPIPVGAADGDGNVGRGALSVHVVSAYASRGRCMHGGGAYVHGVAVDVEGVVAQVGALVHRHGHVWWICALVLEGRVACRRW